MEPSSGHEANKRINFEDLSKEDLIQKCYNLLTIAQKAKQSKNILQEEIQTLKDELSKTKIVSSGTEEIINTLTQKNLSLTMTVDELTSKNKSLSQRMEQCEVKLGENQERIYTLDNENSSYKRQIHRLVDENEQLLTNLDALEKQIEKLNQLGVEQQNQLLQLEKKQILEKKDNMNDNKDLTLINESDTLNKIEELNNIILSYEEKILQKDDQIMKFREEVVNKNDIITELSSKCDNLQKTLNKNLISTSDKSTQFEEQNNKLKEKLKIYHFKIVKLAGVSKMLREDKNHILNLSKSYVDQVTLWKEELQSAKEKCLRYIKNIEMENIENKQKIKDLEAKQREMVSSMNEEKKVIQIRAENEVAQLQKEIENLTGRCSVIDELEQKLEESNQIISNLKCQVDNLLHELDHYKKEIEESNKEKEESKKEKESFNTEGIIKLNNQNLQSIDELKLQNVNLLSNIEELKKVIEKFNSKEAILNDEIRTASKQIEEYKVKVTSMETDREMSKKEINELKNMVVLYESELIKLKAEHLVVCENEKTLLNELKFLQNEKDKLVEDLKDVNDKHITSSEQHQIEQLNCEKRIVDLKDEIKTYQELNTKSNEKIEKLIKENQIHLSEIEKLKEDLLSCKDVEKNFTNIECQTDSVSITEMEQQISDLKRESAELLSDMNEMNQELKERGENISKLQAHCEDLVKKLQVYETQANRNIDSISEKDRTIVNLNKEIEKITAYKSHENVEEITQLKAEIEQLREKLNQNFDSSIADNETMSTSTISRNEEINRLKDLEGSWEERYGKLRNLAVKLKGKIRELNGTLTQQQNENEELQKKLSGNIKTIQNMQIKCDTLEDELSKSQEECKQYLNRLNQIAHDISKDKQQLASKDEMIVDLKQQVEQFIKEKQTTENWKKQVSAKIQTLRKDLEAKELLRKELELKITDLNSELQKKEEILKTESESHNHTKELLEQLKDQVKKNSMLNLEMQDYERSMKEISKKIDKQQEQIVALKTQIDSQKVTIEALREENRALEERLANEQQIVLAANSEIEIYKNKMHKYEESLKEKDDTIDNITKLSEKSRADVEELSIELSKTIAENQKTNENLRNERDHLRNQTAVLQQNIRDVQIELNMKIEEFTNIQNEYEGYKIRAQSVLRQNQNRDIGFEEKLSEEIISLKTKNASLQTELDDYKANYKKLEKDIKEMSAEKDVCWKQMKEFESEVAELKLQYTLLHANHEKTIVENAETVRNMKIHTETLSQCYRQQLSEQEKHFNKEILELKLRLDSALTSTETIPLPPTIPREEAEGSESNESSTTSSHPIPLEKLLESDSNQNIEKIQKQLAEQESKVAHLTALLSETEKDLIKHIQMNNLLKEEIRRHQRSVEREKHAENLEYLKNVVVKFVTLNSGDERTRLVPVLNTILKLSPDETKQLNAVAKGDGLLKGLSNYLPAWSPGKS